MAEDTEWFEALSIDRAKEQRVTVRVWFGTVALLVGLLCLVTYVTV